MMWLYNIVMWLWDFLCMPLERLSGGKTREYFKGAGSALHYWQQQPISQEKPVVWVHCASLGELGVVRPLFKELKKKIGCEIAVTFFSPTGVNALRDKCLADIDYVGFLPPDTKRNAAQLVEILHPVMVIFSVSEYWLNYLESIRAKGIPAYLVGVLMTGKEPHFKWYGGLYRRSLETYTRIFVLSEQSQQLLNDVGYVRCESMGDMLFDNAIAVARGEYHNSVVAQFARQRRLFVAGSLSDENDLMLVSGLANRYKDLRLLIVPHETDADWIKKIQKRLQYPSICYTQCTEHTDLNDVQSLIVDYVGDLARLYRYGTWAYVGGGFTPYLHSVIEATVYGLPVAFGPRIERKVTPSQMMELGIGTKVETEQDLEHWYETLQSESELLKIKQISQEYTLRNSGATNAVVVRMMEDIKID